MDLVLRFDGGAWPNPGPGAYGVVIETPAGELVHSFAVDLGWVTNNEAEWHGCIGALKAARRRGARKILVIGDSQLVIYGASGRWNVNKPKLRLLYQEAMRLVEQFERVDFRWESRERNQAADALAALART